MTIAFLIYFVSILPNISTFLEAIIIFLLIAGFITFMIAALYPGMGSSYDSPEEKEERKSIGKKMFKFFKWIVVFCIVVGFVKSMVPTEKTAWLMLGGYAAQTVYQSEEGVKYRKLIMRKIDEALESKVDDVKNDKTPKQVQ